MLTARLSALRLEAGQNVLDLGCGEGRHVHGLHMLGGVHVVGIDLDTEALEKARQGLATLPPRSASDTARTRFEQGDATCLDFPDNTFDAVICSEVLEHVPDYDAVLAEVRRVLKPQGRLCVSVPHAWPERLCWRLAPPPDGYAFAPGGHIRIFDETDLRISVERRGFTRFKRHHAHALHTPYWWLKCLFWRQSDEHVLIRVYHRFLVWDLMQKPWLTRALDWLLSPILGKSLVLYFQAQDKSE